MHARMPPILVLVYLGCFSGQDPTLQGINMMERIVVLRCRAVTIEDGAKLTCSLNSGAAKTCKLTFKSLKSVNF